MSTMKFQKIISLAVVVGVFIITQSVAAADCSWKRGSKSTSANKICSTYKMSVSSDEAACSGSTKPVFSSLEETSKTAICCCPTTKKAVAPPTPPKFILPDIQIPIPGLNLTPTNSIKTTLNSDGESYAVEIPWISEYIIGIYNYGLSIAGILAAIILMAGGLLWLVSAGDVSKITQAKELITGSVTGLIILMSSYMILFTVNPELTIFRPLTINSIAHQDLALAKAKLGTTAEEYKNMDCPSETELAAGIQFYATGYYKVPFQSNQDLKYLCMMHMQGTCPNGVNTNSKCSTDGNPIFADYPNYQPCQTFTQEQYTSNYFTQAGLIVGQTIAGPISCGGKLAMNNQVCFNGKTYKITDSGGGIQGRRIDILSGSLEEALSNTKTGTLTSGACK